APPELSTLSLHDALPILALAVAGLLWDRGQIQGQLIAEIQGLMGPQGAQAVQTMIANAGRHGSGVLASILGVVTILFGATGWSRSEEHTSELQSRSDLVC